MRTIAPPVMPARRTRETGHQTSKKPALQCEDHLRPTRLVLFCGGRGSNTILQELIRWPHVHTTLLVNGFDDGRSTGELRRFLPGMPGPSDFRKNLSLAAGFSEAENCAWRTVLEYRLPAWAAHRFRRILIGLCEGEPASLPSDLAEALYQLSSDVRDALRDSLRHFFEYESGRPQGVTLDDCAVGNLIMAGAYLAHNRDFNACVRSLTKLCGGRADLIDVSEGGPRVLVALKEDGELLTSEAAIVAPQSRSPILDFFLLPEPLSMRQYARLQLVATSRKRELLRRWERPIGVCAEAGTALRNADVIVYGPGTQFSSLLPSYRLQGLPNCIRENRAAAKVLITNLDSDNDTQTWGIENLIDKALEVLDDPHNSSFVVSHVLCNCTPVSNARDLYWASGSAPAFYRSARTIEADFRDHARPGVHNGYRVVQSLFEAESQRAGRWHSHLTRSQGAV
jgi:2-phospho-L-lactate transferase/gluconeogenesis factor (CofD/UPF0052 family)